MSRCTLLMIKSLVPMKIVERPPTHPTIDGSHHTEISPDA